MRARCLALLVLVCAATAGRLQAAEPGLAVRLWTSDSEMGEPRDRFLPGHEVFVCAAVSASGMPAKARVRISLSLENPRGWRAELKPDTDATVKKLESAYCRSYSFSEALPARMCGRYDAVAHVECGDAPAVDTGARFSIEPPVVLEKAWVDRLRIALPRPGSNRLVVGQNFYFHARHVVSDLVDPKEARLTVEWSALSGEKLIPLSASITKGLDGDPEERTLTRALSEQPPSGNMAGNFTLKCIARLGQFSSEPLSTPFVILSRSLPAPDQAFTSLIAVVAKPVLVRPGKSVTLVAKYRVWGLPAGERVTIIERPLVCAGGRDWALPMRSVERANGFYVSWLKFAVPAEAPAGVYSYEFALLSPRRALCSGKSSFSVQPLIIKCSNLSVWPPKAKPGEQVTFAFRFDVQGLVEGESVPVERVVSIKGPRSMTLRREGWLCHVPGAVYRTRLLVMVPNGWPAGKYEVTALVTCPDASTTETAGSFEISANS